MSTTTITTVTPTAVAPQKRPEYPQGVPAKFLPDGTIQHYPGNTTLCHLPSDCPLIPGLRKLYDAFETHPTLARKVQLLPQASWHMTIFDGIRERECEPGMWPIGMEKLPLPEATSKFSEKLRIFGQRLKTEGLAPPYHVRVTGFDDGTVGSGLECTGATEDEEKRLRRLRDRLADTLGFKAPNHDTYGFHISTLYLLRHMDGEDRVEFERVRAHMLPDLKMEFELRDVEFCTFDTMNEFPRLFYLGDSET